MKSSVSRQTKHIEMNKWTIVVGLREGGRADVCLLVSKQQAVGRMTGQLCHFKASWTEPTCKWSFALFFFISTRQTKKKKSHIFSPRLRNLCHPLPGHTLKPKPQHDQKLPAVGPPVLCLGLSAVGFASAFTVFLAPNPEMLHYSVFNMSN